MMQKEKLNYVSTCCLGDTIRIVTFLRNYHFDDDDYSMHFSVLSDHIHTYMRSWRGRLRFAWDALCGKLPSDIDLLTMEDIENFKKEFDDAYDFATKHRKQYLINKVSEDLKKI